ncbi:hypothetical protein FJZ33_07050 [Candidatus Poribacteria bacterium]|nr:hypothetical protein [Candidatus Poribacteria bacterium]
MILYIRRQRVSVKVLIFLISIYILSSITFPQEAQTQETEIINLENQLIEIERQIVSNDRELRLLNEKLNSVTNEINRLKEEELQSKGFLSSIRGVFRRGRLGKLYTESQTLADDINALNKKREPLVNQTITLSNRLIDRSSRRMNELMTTVRRANQNNDFATRDEAWRQLSYLWQLIEKATDTRRRYAPQAPGPIAVPSLLSNDPEELRLGAAIWKDEASTMRSYVARINEQISNLRRKKAVLEQAVEVSKEIQRRDEERGAVGVGSTNITWGNDAASKKKIKEIEAEINKLLAEKKEFESKAERYESQSKILEQRANQININP